MVSEVTQIRLKALYPDFRVRVIRIFEDVNRATGRFMKSTETLRTFERQQKLYEVGRSFDSVRGLWVVTNPAKKETLTNALPGMSYHAYGLANDSAFAGTDPYLELEDAKMKSELWSTYGSIAKSHGCVWGGDWNGNGSRDPNDFDLPHCQISYGLPVQELMHLYSHGGLAAVWAQLDRIRGVEVGSEWRNSLPVG